MSQREPDRVGLQGRRAWISRPQFVPTAEGTACLRNYLLERPGAHPFWSRWCVSLVHLRPIPGTRPAVLKYPEAAYELLVAALDPRIAVDPDDGPWSFLTPFDLVFQFHGVDDRGALRVVDAYVAEVVEDGASPDSDHRRWWESRLADIVAEFRRAS